MIDMILKWLYQNAAAIIISSSTSLLISMLYYRKGNRDELLMNIIFPVVQLLNRSYSKKNYDELLVIKSNYAIRYLGKKERRILMLLIEQYNIVFQYSKSRADTDCILSYFDFKLGEIGINPKTCLITDDEGETVAYDYPPDFYHLAEYVDDMVSKMEFAVYPEEAEKTITDAFEKYAHKYYTDKKIEWFQDYSIERVIEKSKVSEKWKDNFELTKHRKNDFINLSISQKVIKILQG